MKGMAKGLLSVAVMGCVVAASAQTTFPLRVDIDVSAKRSTKQVGAGSSGEAEVEYVHSCVSMRK